MGMKTNITLTMSKVEKERSVARIVADYGKKLFSFIRERVGSIEDAEDILQDVWYQFSNLASISEIESISGWLYSVTRNRITDLYRKKKTDHLEDYLDEDDEGDFRIREILLMDTGNNPDLTFFKETFWNELFRALNELPENQSKVFVLNEIEDKPLREIADLEGVNLKTIISRKGYAVKHLKKKLLPLYQSLNE